MVALENGMVFCRRTDDHRRYNERKPVDNPDVVGELTWRKSSYCADNTCVEVAWLGNDVLIRDAKDPGGPVLKFSPREWAAFIDGVCDGEFQGTA